MGSHRTAKRELLEETFQRLPRVARRQIEDAMVVAFLLGALFGAAAVGLIWGLS